MGRGEPRAAVELTGLPAKLIRFPVRAVLASLENDLRALGRHHREQSIRIGAAQEAPAYSLSSTSAAGTAPGQVLSSISTVVTAMMTIPATPTATRRAIDHGTLAPRAFEMSSASICWRVFAGE